MFSSLKNTLILLVPLIFSTAGCSLFFPPPAEKEDPATSMVISYTADSLRNYKAGRDFSAAGRYELAREHYLLALASANDPVLREALGKEVESIDLMIKSLR